MHRSYIIGIDPGLSGAVTILSPDGRLEVHDMPVAEVQRHGKAKREVDCAALASILRPHVGGAHACLERVGAMPGQGVTSMFAFGRAVGAVEGVLAALGVPVSYVAPVVWKRALAVPTGKDGARLRASQLMPAYAERWRRAKDDGRAESALIALYAMTAAQCRDKGYRSESAARSSIKSACEAILNGAWEGGAVWEGGKARIAVDRARPPKSN